MAEALDPSRKRTLFGWAVLALPLVLMFFLFVTPVIRLAVMSLFDLNAANFVEGGEFIGFRNYADLLNDPGFAESVFNTFFSPLLILRMLLCAALPFSIAFLFMELRSGARIVLQAALAPVILFSGAALTAVYYYAYYAPSGLLNDFLVSSGILSRPSLEYAIGLKSGFFGNILNMLLANGLALSLPLGLAFFLAAARGARATALDSSRINRELFARLGRVFVAFLFVVIGFSFLNLEGAWAINNALAPRPDIISHAIRNAIMLLRFSYGAAAATVLIPPLLVIGLGIVLFLERKNAPVSLRFLPKMKGRLSGASEARGGKIALLVGAGIGTLVLVYVLITAFFLPWLGGTAAATGPGGKEALAAHPDFFPSLFISLATALTSALLCHLLTSVMGFSLGYLRPRGGKAVIVLLGLCLFLSPVVLSIPYYFGFRELGLLSSVWTLVIPYLVSPLGALLFTWFFRGARDERDWLAAQGLPFRQGALARRMAGGFLRFSLPMFAFYFLSSLNMLLLPFMMVSNNPEVQPLSYLLYRLQVMNNYLSSIAIIDPPPFMPPGMKESLAQLSLLQYVIPLALLVVSIIFVFPRLALVIRRKGEAAPGLDEETLKKLRAE
jgi:multiple sugar transport system permease protein